jgi:hypothetical protein
MPDARKQSQQRKPKTGKQGPDTTIGPVFQVRDLTGGVNLRTSATNIRPEQARRLLNTLISSNGELGVYPGFLSFSTASLASRRLQGAKRIYLSGATFTLGADNGSVYKPDDAGVWGAAVLATLHATNAVDFVYDRDIVAAFDSSTVPKKSTDGSTWTQLGISAPTVAPTASAVAGGSLVNGDTYEVAYAFGNSTLNQIGNISTKVQQAAAGANLTVRVNVTASADTQIDQIKVYVRDVTAGETVLRLYATYANTTTSRDVTSNTWSAADEAPTDHDVAVPMAFGVVWKNRWWGRDATVGNRLRFSQIFANMSWPSTFFVDIPFERGESITALIPLGDVLVVFGYTKFYLIIGQTSLDFEVRPALGGQTGAFGFRAADVLENGVVHAGSPGVYLFNGANDELLSYTIDPGWRDMVTSTISATLAIVAITYHKLAKELRVAVPTLYPTGTLGEWILDLNRTNAKDDQGNSTGPAWFSTDRTIGGYVQWDGNEIVAGNQGRIFSWSPTVAKLFEERVGTTADGADRDMEYDGYMLPFGLQMARIIDTYLEYQPASGTLTVNLKVDGRLMGEQSFSLSGALSVYGVATYGVSLYSGGADRTTLPIMWPINAEGRAVQLLLKYVGTGDFKAFTYGHNVFAEPVPRGI